MNRVVLCLAGSLLLIGCATTSTISVQKGMEDALRSLRIVKILPFESENDAIARAIQNSIIETFLPAGIKIVTEGNADAVIKGVVTFSEDIVSSASSGVAEVQAGRYVSGVTAQILKGSEILAVATVTQVRIPHVWIPDPAELMGSKLGKNIVGALRGRALKRD